MSVRRVIATVAPKGGVGKTYIAKLLFDLLPLHGRTIAAWDLDSATGTFAVYDDAIKTFDLNSSQDNTYSWLDDAYREDVDDVLIDVPGGRVDDLLRTFGDNTNALVAAVRSANREFVLVNPIGVNIAETVTAQVVLNAFAGTDSRVVIVKNGRFGDVTDFVIYDGVQVGAERRYGATGDLALSIGAETIFLPCLAARLLAQVDAERLRLVDAVGPVGAERLGRLNATRLQIYLNSVEAAFRGTSLAIDGIVPQRVAR